MFWGPVRMVLAALERAADFDNELRGRSLSKQLGTRPDFADSHRKSKTCQSKYPILEG